jgi:hypothetical protein
VNRVGWARRALTALPLVLLLFVAVWQTVDVAQNFAGRLVAKVWVNRQLDAVSRSADVAYGEDYRRYIEFLRQKIPEDARVVVLRISGFPQYESRSFLQYFLFPRRVLICTQEGPAECVLEFQGPDTYFIYRGGLELPVAAAAAIEQVEFVEGEGILAPVAGSAP